MPLSNPLLHPWDLPPWSAVRAEHLMPAITAIIAANRQAIGEIVDHQTALPGWDDLVLAVDDTDARLDEAMGIVEVLATVNHDSHWTLAIEGCNEAASDYRLWKSTHQGLFRAYQTLQQSALARSFDPARKFALSKVLRKFQLSGIALTSQGQETLARLNDEIDRLETLFLNNLDRANSRWRKHIDDVALLEGLPQAIQDHLARLAKDAGLGGWLLPLDHNTYHQVMTYAEHRPLREEYFHAYSTRASDQGPHAGLFDNGPVLASLLALRQQKAELLGYADFAQLRLAMESSQSTLHINAFLRQQLALTRPALVQERQALEAFAQALGAPETKAWDQDFLAQKWRDSHFSGALKGLRDYFPLEGTLHRLCLFSERMFGIQLVEQKTLSHWHAHVRLFEVRENGQALGHLYIDPYKRPGLADFAGTGSLRNRRVDAEGRVTLPIALLNGNFTPPTDSIPCLLSHIDLRVLFHEFGHCLQHILTRSPHHILSGISQMGRESAEFAGQFFERWCLSKAFLLWLAAHHQTGERLSETRVELALAAIQTQTSQATALLQMGALLDFELHRCHGDGRSVQQVFTGVQREAMQLQLPAYCRFANGFDYLVTGYEALVYAYLWSGKLAAQAFKRFEQQWVFNPATGRAFRETFFSSGDPGSLLTAVQRFLGHPVDELFSTPSPENTH